MPLTRLFLWLTFRRGARRWSIQRGADAGRPSGDHRGRLPDLGPQHPLRGQAGRRPPPRVHRDAFSRIGAEAQLITVPGAASLQTLILVDEGGERTVICRRDDRLLLQPEDFAGSGS